MKNSNVVIVLCCIVVTAGLAYNQLSAPEQTNKGTHHSAGADDKSLSLTSNTKIEHSLSHSQGNASVDSLPEPKSLNPSAKNTLVNIEAKNQSVQTQNHEKPADHLSASQPKAHGHEHSQHQRHPEDNSIIPPGEPKKPVPEQINKS